MAIWGSRVVLADDGSEDSGFAMLLERAGARVIRVNDSGHALAAISGVMPDLFLLDAETATFDGLTLLRTVRTLSPGRGGRVPAAILCGGSFCAGRREAWRVAGFQACLAKPFPAGELLELAERFAGTDVERRGRERPTRRPAGAGCERRREHRWDAVPAVLEGYRGAAHLLA